MFRDRSARGVAHALAVCLVASSALALVGSPVAAVVNGDKVTPEEFEASWSSTVYLDTPCTGTLIDVDVVLTAAHCVVPETPPTVYYGSEDLGLSSAVSVSRTVRHLAADVALLFLGEPLDSSVVARPAGLASTTPTPGAVVEIAGWGLTSSPDGDPSDVLRTGTTTITGSDGKVIWSENSNGAVCQGDSGGPMVDPETRRVIGVASVEQNFCTTNGHVATAAVLPWILVEAEGLSPVLLPDEYRGIPGEPLTVDAGSGVLANDTPYGTGAPSVVEPPAAGDLTLNSDGSFEYVPDDGFAGIDGFSYQVANEAGTSFAGVTIVVNRPPNALDDHFNLPIDEENWPGSVPIVVPAPGVLGNDDDPDGHGLVAQSVGEVLVEPDGLGVTARVDVDASGAFTLSVDAVEASSILNSQMAFRYRASDDVESSDDTLVTIEFSNSGGDDPPPPPPPPPSPSLFIGDTFDEFIAPTAAGGDWSLADVSDDVIVLHLCLGWCDPCRTLASQLGTGLLAELENAYGADGFEIVEVLIDGFHGDPSTATDAETWAREFSGNTVPVLHSEGSADSAVQDLAEAVGVTEFPTLMILDRHRRIADIRTVPYQDTAFADAIAHGLAVGDLPLDVSYDSPTPATIEVSIDGNATKAPWVDDVSGQVAAELTVGDAPLLAVYDRGTPRAGTFEWWSREETRTVTVVDQRFFDGETVDTFDSDPPVALSLDGITWSDAYDRAVTARVVPLSVNGTEIVYGEDQVLDVTFHDGQVVIDPIATDGWQDGTVAFELSMTFIPQFDPSAVELLERLIEDVAAADLHRRTERLLTTTLDLAMSLLSDADDTNDALALLVLDGFVVMVHTLKGIDPVDAEEWSSVVESIAASL